MRDHWWQLGGVLVRGVELLCALFVLLSAWMLGVLAESPAAQQGEGTFAVGFILAGTTVLAVLVAVLAGHAVVRLARTPSGGRLDAVADALPRLAVETGVAALTVVVWPLAPDHVVFDVATAFAVAVALHVAVDVWRFGRSMVG